MEAPRTTDAIGFALRDTYADDRDLPDDMRDLLSQLSRIDVQSARDSHS
ncbi:hypothetical protein K9B35_18560 [Sphingomonas sp. R647]|nr:hypothetical protein [Sphingomonas sp. R647]MCA1199972.1 hypothetical protein [Sphingomonas sp. R647]